MTSTRQSKSTWNGRRGTLIALLAVGALLSVTAFGMRSSEEHKKEKRVFKIEEAKWRPKDNQLRVKGKSVQPSIEILIYDSASGLLLGRTSVRDEDQWEFRSKRLTVPPCRIKATAGDLIAEKDVEGAGASCGSIPDQPANRPPSCEVTGPNAVDVGVPVTLTGLGQDPEAADLSYSWFFGGGVDGSSTGQTPSGTPFQENVVFDVGGQVFQIVLTVTDPEGLNGTCSKAIQVGALPDTNGRPPVPEQPAPGNPQDQEHVVLAFNDLGMHCADLGSIPFSVLPPFNVFNAQVIRRGNVPQIIDDSLIELRYSAASNPLDPVIGNQGSEPPSINSTSQNYPVGSSAGEATIRKTDFWDPADPANPGGPTVVETLFGIPVPPDEGLPTIHNVDGVGRRMPGISDPYHANEPQPFSTFQTEFGWFKAEGIPMTSVDDFGRSNSYPLMRTQAVHKTSGVILGAIDAVVPVSTEVDCRDCHAIGGVGADPAFRKLPFKFPSVPGERVAEETAAKANILVLHDFKHGTTLASRDTVLCAACHNSFALEEVAPSLTGRPGLPSMSAVMHGYHGRLIADASSGNLLRDPSGEPILTTMPGPQEESLFPVGPNIPMEMNCFHCHPGKITQCFRGAMFEAGIKCDGCHGDMLALGGVFEGDFAGSPSPRRRLPWRDEPRCESCHQGDAVSPGKGSMLRTAAFRASDPAAVPLLADNRRFGENRNSQTGGLILYRNSLGHGGVACEGCHGSPHAIWANPNPNANDNITSMQLQGHRGTVTECTVCHLAGSFPNGTLNGPHGMHPVNDPNWIKSDGGWHGEFADAGSGADPCAACHGADHRGSRLSKTPVDRILRDAEGKVRAQVSAGQMISCDLCHSLEKSFDN